MGKTIFAFFILNLSPRQNRRFLRFLPEDTPATARFCSLTLHTLTGFALRGEVFSHFLIFLFIQHFPAQKGAAAHRGAAAPFSS